MTYHRQQRDARNVVAEELMLVIIIVVDAIESAI